MPHLEKYDLIYYLPQDTTFLYVVGIIFLSLLFLDFVLAIFHFAFYLLNVPIDDLRDHYIE